MRLDARKQRLLLYTQRRKKHARSSLCTKKEALIQLTRAVMEVGYLLKYILVVLVFFGLAFLVKIW